MFGITTPSTISESMEMPMSVRRFSANRPSDSDWFAKAACTSGGDSWPFTRLSFSRRETIFRESWTSCLETARGTSPLSRRRSSEALIPTTPLDPSTEFSSAISCRVTAAVSQAVVNPSNRAEPMLPRPGSLAKQDSSCAPLAPVGEPSMPTTCSRTVVSNPNHLNMDLKRDLASGLRTCSSNHRAPKLTLAGTTRRAYLMRLPTESPAGDFTKARQRVERLRSLGQNRSTRL